jgi:hypothetical protein
LFVCRYNVIINERIDMNTNELNRGMACIINEADRPC